MESLGGVEPLEGRRVLAAVQSFQATDGFFNAGDEISIGVTFDAPVNVVDGTDISLDLDFNDDANKDAAATYIGLSADSKTLNFKYTVNAGDNASDLNATAISLGGGSVNNQSDGGAANLSLPSLSADRDIVLDTTSPTLTVSRTGTGTLAAGDTETINFNLSESSTNFDLGDINVTGGTTDTFTKLDGQNYTAVFTPDPNSTTPGQIFVLGGKFTDAAGNDNDLSGTLTLTVDTEVPTVAISRTGSGTLATGDSETINFNLSESSTNFDVGDINVTGGKIDTFTGLDGQNYTAVFTPDPNSTTPGQIFVLGGKFTDAADNGNGPSSTLTLAVDTLAPTVTISRTGSGTLAAGDTETINFNLSEPSADFDSADITVVGGKIGTLTNLDGQNYTAVFTPDADSTTTGQISVAAGKLTDAAGNPNTVSNTESLPVDTLAPATAPTLALGTGETVVNATEAALALVTVTGEVDATLNVTFQGPDGQVTASVTGTGSPVGITLTAGQLNAIGDGTITVSATQTDKVGNIQTAPAATISFLLDTTAPTAPQLALGPGVSDPVSAVEATQGGGVVLVTGEAGATITVDFTGTAGTAQKTLTGTGGAQAVILTAGDLTALGDGFVTVEATQTDSAGNLQVAGPTTLVFTLDATLPVAPTLTLNATATEPVSRAEAIAASGIYDVTGDVGATITITFTSTAGVSVTRILTGTNAAQSVILVDADVTTLGDGTVSVVAKQTDAAGNEGALATTSFALDATAPAAPTVALRGGATDPLTAAEATHLGGVVTVSGEVGGTITIVFTGTLGVVTKSIPSTGGSAQPVVLLDGDLTTLGDGPVSVSVTQTDAAGNESAASTTIFTLDTAEPVAATIALGSGVTDPVGIATATQPDGVVLVTGEAGSELTVTFTQGTNVVTKTIAGSGSPEAVVLTQADVTALGSGTVAVEVTQSDAAGNDQSAAANTVSFDLDAAAPPAASIALEGTVTSPVSVAEATQGDGIVEVTGEADATITVTFTGQDGSVVKTLTGTGPAQAVRLTVDDLATLGDGFVTVTASQTDEAGNPQTAAAASVNFTLDANLAPIPTLILGDGITSPVSEAEATQAAGVVVVTGELGATITVEFTQGVNTVTKTVTGTGAPQIIELSTADLGTLGDGAVTAEASQIDTAGNPSGTATLAFVLDATAPPAPTLALGSGVTAPVSLAEATQTAGMVTVMGEVGSTIVVTLTQSANAVVKTLTGTGAPQPIVLTTSEIEALGDGSVVAVAVQIDVAGNEGPAAAPVTFDLDTVAPAAPLLTLGPNVADGATAAEAAQLGGAVRVVGEAGATVTVTFVGASGANIPITVTGAGPGVPVAVVLSSANVTSLGSGMVTVTALQTDLAGNQSDPSEITFDIDADVPTAPTLTLGAGIANGATLAEASAASGVILVSGELNNTIDVTLVGQDGTITRQLTGTGVQQTIALSAADVGILGEGTVTVTATQTDPAGNESLPATATFDIDTVLPVAPEITTAIDDVVKIVGPVDHESSTNDATPTISGTAEPNSTVTLSMNGVELSVVTASGAGAWSYTTPPLAEGSYTFTAVQADAAGNAGPTTSLPYTIVVDLTNPTIQSVSVTDGIIRDGETITFTMIFDEQVDVTGNPTLDFFIDNPTVGGLALARSATFAGALTPNTLLFNYTLNSAADGNTVNGITLDQIDLAGGEITDTAGNDAVLVLLPDPIGVGTTFLMPLAVTITSIAPQANSVDATTGNSTADPRATPVSYVTVTFDNPVPFNGAGGLGIFDLGDFELTRDGVVIANVPPGNVGGQQFPSQTTIIQSTADPRVFIITDLAPITEDTGTYILTFSDIALSQQHELTWIKTVATPGQLTATVSVEPGNTGLRTEPVDSVTVEFSEITINVTLDDFVFVRDGGANLLAGPPAGVSLDGSGTTYTIRGLAGLQTGEGFYRFELLPSADVETLAGGRLISAEAATWNFDLEPTISSVTLSSATGTMAVGETLELDVTFSEEVFVTGTPNISLLIGNQQKPAAYVSGNGSTTLRFEYTVQSGDEDLNGLTFAGDAINLNGGSILDTAGNAARLRFTPADLSAVLVDGQSPAVASVIAPAAGEYTTGGASDTLTVTVVFDEPITVVTAGGTPSVSITIGGVTRQAAYDAAASNGNVVVFEYAVIAADSANGTPGSVAIGTEISLNGGTLRDASGNDASLALPAAPVTNVVVNRLAATVTASPNGTYGLGEPIQLTATFTQPVIVTEQPTIVGSINTEAGSRTVAFGYVTGTTTNTLTFRYIVSVGDLDTDGIEVFGEFDFAGGAIRNAAGDSVALAFTAPSTSLIKVDGVVSVTPTVDTLIANSATPTITGTAALGDGESLTVTVNGGTYNVAPVDGLWSVDLSTAADTGTTGVFVDGDTYSVTATVTDGAGNTVTDSTSGELRIDTTTPAVMSVTSSTPDGTYGAGQAITIAVQLSEAVTVDTTLGNPTLTLNTTPARSATFTGVAGNVLTFTYTSQAGDNAADLDATGVVLNGAVIEDAAGNTADFTGLATKLSTAAAIVIDTAAPTAPTVSATLARTPLPVITGTTGTGAALAAGSTLTVTVDSVAYNVTPASDGTWTLDLATAAPITGVMTPLADGTHSVTAVITNGSRLSTTDTTANELGIDTVAPSAPSVDSLTTNETLPVLTGTASLQAGETLSIAVGGNSYSDVAVENGVWKLDMASATPDGETSPATPLTDATYSVTATVTDEAGNASRDITTGELVVDTVAPTVTLVSAEAADGVYGIGQVITIRVLFSEPVALETTLGMPSLTLNTTPTRSATFQSATNGLLTFTYAPVAGDTVADLNATALQLGLATLTDLAGNDADVTLPASGVSGSLDSNAEISIDTTAPAAPSVEVVATGVVPPTVSGTIGTADLAADETLTVEVNGAIYENVPVTPGTGSTNGTWSINLRTAAPASGTLGTFVAGQAYAVTATVRDAAGNATSDLTTNEITIERMGGTVTLSSGTARTYTLGEVIELTATFTEPVTVTGAVTLANAPSIDLVIGTQTRNAVYVSGSGTTQLKFQYTVVAGDLDDNGISVASRIRLAAVANAPILVDAAGNEVSLAFAPPATTDALVDGDAPRVQQILVPPPGNYLPGAGPVPGDVLTFSLLFDDAVAYTKSSAPGAIDATIPVVIGSRVRQAVFAGGSGTNTLVFEYEIAANDTTSVGITLNPLVLNGATIRDAGGNDAVLDYTAPDTSGIVINQATLNAVSLSSNANAWYRAGEAVEFKAKFNTPVSVVGVPTLSLAVGSAQKTAFYSTGTGTDELTFFYPVETGDRDPDGIQFSTYSIGLPNGARIRNGGGDAIVGFQPVNTTGVRVDGTSPQLLQVIGPDAGTYSTGETLQFMAMFDESVMVDQPDEASTAMPRIAIVVGSSARHATFVAGSETPMLLFEYEVQAGDMDTNGIVASTAISLNTATITDIAGNPGTLTFPAIDLRNVLVDSSVPTVTRFSSSASNRSYGEGATIQITATMSETVQAGSAIEAVLDTGATVMLTTTTASTVLSGTYTVAEGENSSDLTVAQFFDAGVLDLTGNALANENLPAGKNIADIKQIVVDTTAPDAPVIALAAGVTEDVSRPEAIQASGLISVTGDAGATITLTFTSGAAEVQRTVRSTGAPQAVFLSNANVDALGSGLITVAATQADAAGNLQVVPEAVLTFSLDAVAPTISIISSTQAVKIGETAVVLFTLSEPSADFAAGDVNVTGGTLENFVGGGTNYTATFRPDANWSGNAVISVPAGRFTDAAGNPNTAGMLAPPIAVDTLPPQPPVLLLSSGVTDPVNAAEATRVGGVISIVAEAGATVTVVFTGPDGAVPVEVAGTGMVQGVELTQEDVDAIGDGVVTVTATQTDAAGNPQTDPPASLSFTLDGQGPTVTVTVPARPVKAGDTPTLTFTLSESSTNFTATDVQLSSGTLSDFMGSGMDYSATFTPAADFEGTVTVQVATGRLTDAVGNPNSAAVFDFEVDTLPPTVTDLSFDVPLGAYGVGAEIGVTGALSEPATPGQTLTVLLNVTDPGFAVTLTVEAGGMTLAGTYTVAAGHNTDDLAIIDNAFVNVDIADVAGNPLQSGEVQPAGSMVMSRAFAFAADTIVIDTVNPTIGISSNVTGTLKAGDTALITFTLSEPAADFSIDDVDFSNGSLEDFAMLSDTLYTARFVPAVGSTAAGSISIPQGRFQDIAGNGNDASSPLSLSLPMDTVAPSVLSFTSTTASGTYGVAAEIALNATISETVRANSSITVTLDTGAEVVLSTPTAGSVLTGTYVVQNGDATNDLQVTSFAKGDLLDVVGNAIDSLALPSTNINDGSTIQIDGIPPTIVAFGATSTPGFFLENDLIEITATVSEDVRSGGFIDVILDTGATVRLAAASTGPGLIGSYTVATGHDSANLRVVSFSSGSLLDAVGNVLVDTSLPAINIPAGIVVDTTVPNAPTLSLVLDTGLSLTDRVTSDGRISVLGLEPSATWEYRTTGGSWTDGTGSTFTVPQGTYAAGAIEARQADRVGNISVAGSNLTQIVVDTSAPVAPTAVLVSDTGYSNVDGITSDGRMAVTGIEANATWEYSINSGTTWSVGTGTSFTLPAGTFAAGSVRVRQTDLAGNGSSVWQNGSAITVDASAPVAPTAGLVSDTGSSNVDGITSDGRMAVTGIEANATWEYSINSGTTWSVGTGTSFTLPAGTFAAGSVRVRQTDLAGNGSSVWQNGSAITVDASAPVAPTVGLVSDTGSSNVDGITSDGRMAVTGIEPNSTWEYSINSGTTWSVGSGTSFTLPTGTFAAGAVRVRQTDQAGNGSNVGQNNAAITVDASAPTVAVARVGSGTLKSGDTATIAFTLSEASTNFTRADVTATGGTLSGFSGSGRNYSATFTPAANSTTEGTVSVLAGTFTDAAGNDNEASNTVSLPVDTQAPVVIGITATVSKEVLDAGDTIALRAVVSEEVPAGSRIAVRLSSQGLGKPPVILTAMMNGTVLVGTHVVELGEVSTAPLAEVVAAGTTATDLVGNPLNVDGARFDLPGFTVDAGFKVTDALWGPATPDGYAPVTLNFNGDLTGLGIDAITIVHRGRSVSLRNASLSGSGSTYVLRLPERIQQLDGTIQIYIYSELIRVGDPPGTPLTKPIVVDLPNPGVSTPRR